MHLQKFLRTSRTLGALGSLGDVFDKNLNGRVANNLLNTLCDNNSSFDQIYVATLAALAPATVMIRVQGGVLPKNSDLAAYGDDWQFLYASKCSAAQKVADFEIGLYPITLNEWQRCRKWALENDFDMAVGATGLSGEGGPENAVTEVSWYDCVKWCNAKSVMEGLEPVYRVEGEMEHFRSGEFGEYGYSNVIMRTKANGYRLPLEAEWEWAARKCISQALPYGKGENSFAWEWCWNVEDFIPRRLGGTWTCIAATITVSGRDSYFKPDSRMYDTGFRIARSLEN
jgi:formylglycine-generating enzyme required for sulfatase activity